MNSNAAHYFSGEFDFADDASDSGADDEDATSDSLVLPALKYLKRCCVILTSMWRMPACPTFGTAQHIRAASRPLRVDPVIPGFDFAAFERNFRQSEANPDASSDVTLEM